MSIISSLGFAALLCEELLTSKYLFQCNIWVTLSEHIFLQLQLAMLDSRDGDAVDVADGTVTDAESGEDTQTDIVFLHFGILLTDMGKAVIVNGIERTLYLTPFMRTEGDERITALVKFLDHSGTFEDVVLQECYHFVGLMQLSLLMCGLLLKLTFLLFLQE